ncbi:MAG: metallophosphoesterase family protein [Anaerolineales bacterium]
MPPSKIQRREFLNLVGLASLTIAAGCTKTTHPTNPQTDNSPQTPAKRSLRIAHMTDFHVMPQATIQENVAKAFRQVQALSDPADFILNTGDSIMDSLKSDKDSAEEQWQTFLDLIQKEVHMPIYHAIGNHDVWGWGLPNQAIKNDPLYGKGMALQKLKLAAPYYSFDLKGWHFIILDSTHLPNSSAHEPYIGQLDDEQFSWLEKDIQKTPKTTPICIASHIPIVSACEMFDGNNEDSGNWVIPAAWVHIDARRFRQLFLKNPNIRVCLSGHTHQHERVDYLGVTYLTNGAVCGNWWMGSYMDFPPAYVIVDLYEDGTVRSQFVSYQNQT